VIVGGVATSRGDLRCTNIVDRCLVAGEEPEAVAENAAMVVGFMSSLVFPLPWSERWAGEDAMSASQGVSTLTLDIAYNERWESRCGSLVVVPNAAIHHVGRELGCCSSEG